MKFTDDNLKTLKENMRLAFGDGSTMRNLEALLHRLECAERALECWELFSLEIHSSLRDTKKEFMLRMDKANAMEAWRLSKGER